MGQKVHPNGLRVGVIKDWESKWYADSKNYSDYLVEDYKIRKYVKQKLLASGISKIEIERTAKMVKVNLYTAKPGIVIGKGGAGVETVKAEVAKLIGKDVKFTELDDEGNEKDPETGTVEGAYKENGLVYVKIKTEEGETKSVTYDRINSVGKVD